MNVPFFSPSVELIGTMTSANSDVSCLKLSNETTVLISSKTFFTCFEYIDLPIGSAATTNNKSVFSLLISLTKSFVPFKLSKI